MGFEVPSTVYQLDFADTEYAGLEVAVRATTIEEFLYVQELLDGMDTPKGMRSVFASFGALLVSWNVTKNGAPVPADEAGLMGLEEPLVTAIILAWQRRIIQAPPPLPGTSPSGATSPEASLDLASQSASLQS